MTVRARIVTVGLVAVFLGLAPARVWAADGEASPSSDEGKSPWIAAALSGGAAVLGYGTALAVGAANDGSPAPLFFGGLAVGLFGPAAGHIYAGKPEHAVLFALGRMGFVALAFTGLSDLLEHDDGETGPANKPVDEALMGVGLAGVLGLTVWEILDSASCAASARRSPRPVAFAPFLVSGPGGSSSTGLLVSGRF
jgi:hypothetical protein